MKTINKLVFNNSSGSKFHKSSDADCLASRLAAKFSLDVRDVKRVIDSYRKEKELTVRKRFIKQLRQAVAEGRLVRRQMRKLLAKFDEVSRSLSKIKSIGDQVARRQTVKQLRASLKSWAEANKIPSVWLSMGGLVQGYARL